MNQSLPRGVFPTVLALLGLTAVAAADQRSMAASELGRARAAAAMNRCDEALELRAAARAHGSMWAPLASCFANDAEREASQLAAAITEAGRAGDCMRVAALTMQLSTVHVDYHAYVSKQDASVGACRLHHHANIAASAKQCTLLRELVTQLETDYAEYYTRHVAPDQRFDFCMGRPVQTTSTGNHDAPIDGFAVGTNFPLWWQDNASVGASLMVGFADRHAIRGNVMSHKATGGLFSEASYRGRITDVGFGWMYFPRRLWSGFSFEAGALVRNRDYLRDDLNDSPQILDTRTTTYAGRAQIGWSWLIGSHVFIATAIGLSIGYEVGSETSGDYDMLSTAHVARVAASMEGYFRFGFAM
ncbi:MAG: hypothetical protein AB7O24_26910 [Kofleriaceae bacterium]